MRRSFLVVLATSAALSALACTSKEAPKKQEAVAHEAVPTNDDLVKRGKFLVGIGGCNDCHTPMKFDPGLGMPVPMMERALSGHPEGAPDPGTQPGNGDQAVIGPTFTSFRLPFGTVYSANLTPDNETGLGLWSEEQFVRAIRTGKHRGAESGRPILPPMPWINVNQNASDEDLRAIYIYLRTVPAVKNHVAEPQVPPPVLQAISESYGKLAMK